ncbi:MAG: ferrous iron transport protein B [Flavobacteriales bacterium]|nr:ferrous iron transport protein B [Flavobacteriales bacterium]
MASNHKKIALIGNPNSGKSTLFNALTGLNQHVGNFPGVTVDKKTGSLSLRDDAGVKEKFEIIDLPGTYSLYPKSVDELVTFEVLCDPENPDYPDQVIVVADSTNMPRCLFLATQVIELNLPTVLALNMADLAEKDGLQFNIEQLEKELGVPVVLLNARKKFDVRQLRDLIAHPPERANKDFIHVRDFSPELLERVREAVKVNSDYAAFQVACNHKFISYFKNHPDRSEHIQELVKEHEFRPYRFQADESKKRYELIPGIIARNVRQAKSPREHLTDKIDNVITHKVWGYVIFLSILFVMFQAVFSWATFPMEWIEYVFTGLTEYLAEALPPGILTGLLLDGVLAGLSGVVVFVPQIAFLFFFIALLEDTGYMSRVSFMMDKLMRRFGLNGRSVIPLVGGFACAIPAIMATRSISGWKQRLITILITPLMSCSARLPVYTLLISLVIPSEARWGIFNVQGLILMGLYLLGFVAAIVVAFLLNLWLNEADRSFFVMELPGYKWPDWKTIGYTLLEKVRIFLFNAGKIIVAISIVLWFLSSYGPGDRMQKIEEKYDSIELVEGGLSADLAAAKGSEKLEASYAGIVGKTIEPVIRLLGYDWKIGIALITSFAAREVFVGTMATIYSVGDPDNETSIREKMQSEVDQISGKKQYGLPTGVSLMVFYAFALQCMSTVAVVRRETNSWKWPLAQFLFMGAMAYIASLITYQLLA